MGRIAIVTDSTSDMPLSFYEESDITMVPLVVRFGEELYKDWVEMPPAKFYPKLRGSSILPKTSQPSVQEFVDVYEKLSGYEHIISVHISSKLSGTYQSADIASKSVSTPVTVVDTRLASVANGALLKELVKMRDAGGTADEMAEFAGSFYKRGKIVFSVDTLKYLEMGGRIGKASALAGSILSIKPILAVDSEGEVEALAKVKGRKKALREMVDLAKGAAQAAEAGGGSLNLCFAHGEAPDAIEELQALLKQEGINYNTVVKSELGSVIGTYTGPGTFAIFYYSVI